MVGCGVGVLLWVFSCLVKWPGISLFGRYGYPHVSVSVGCKGVFVVGLDEVGEISSIGGGCSFIFKCCGLCCQNGWRCFISVGCGSIWCYVV